MKAKLKRFLSSLLVAALLLQMAPFEALATDSVAAEPPVVSSEPGESTEPTKPADEAVYDDDVSPPETYIEGEVMEARDEYEKHYRLTDGSFLAAQFQVPVHYEADGSWEDIDNTLDGVALYDGTEVYQAVNGDHVQSFSSTLADGTVLSIADGEQSLTMALWDGEEGAAEDRPIVIDQAPENSSTEEQTAALEPTEPASTPEESPVESEPEETTVSTPEEETADTDSAALDAETEAISPDDAAASEPEETQSEEPQPDEAAEPAEPETAEEEPEPEDALPVFNRETKAEILTGAASPIAVQSAPELREVTDVIPETLENAVIYRDVYPGVDLKYETFSYNVKESIILNAPAAPNDEEDDAESASRYVYTFLLTLDGLTPEPQEDGSILLQNDDGETEYTIPAPFMEDSTGCVSTDVAYTLTETAEGWLLTVQAAPEWLDAADRVYPVTIDPTISKKVESPNFKGTSTYSIFEPTGYLASNQMIAGKSAKYGDLEMFFKVVTLPAIPAGHTVIDAKIGLKIDNNFAPEATYFGISKLTSALTDAQFQQLLIPWNERPSYGEPMDYLRQEGTITQSTLFYWDITSAAKDWYEAPSTNYGLAIASLDYNYTHNEVWTRYVRDTAVFIVNYRNTTGIESYYTYEEQNILRAGNGYVGDYSSSLTLVKDDLSFSSTSMPFTLSHIYNSDLYSGNISDSWLLGVTAADYINMRTGFGWQLSAQESVGKTTVGGTAYLVYRDGDGTMHFFTYDSSSRKYKDEDGLNLTIAAGSSGGVTTYTMTDDDGNTRFFYGSYLTYIKDANGNRICFVYNGKSFSATGTGWYPSTSGSYLSAIYAVSSGNASNSLICTLAYDQNHYLDTITDYAGRTTTFDYSGLTENSAYLTKVTHPDGTTATYGYEPGRLNRAYDSESKYGMAYKYSGGGISEIWEYTDTTTGSRVLRHKNGVQETYYRYVGDDRTQNTADDIVTKYTFDYAGRTINAVTLDNTEREVLGVTAAAYTTNTARSGKNNRVEKDAQSGQNGVNLLVAGGLEIHDTMTAPANSWTRLKTGTGLHAAIKNTATDSTTITRNGNGSLKIYLEGTAAPDADGVRRMGMYQNVSLTAGTTYTFSSYINTRDVTTYIGDGGLYIAFMDTSGNILASSERIVAVTNSEIEDGWQRVHVTYTPTTTGTYRVAAIQEDAYLYGYFDDLQLEVGNAPSNVNLLQNGSFNGSAEWTMGNFHTASGDTLHSGVIEAKSNPDAMRRASQTIPIVGPATNTYLLSGWACASSTADTESALTDETAESNAAKRYFGLIAKCTYSDTTKEYFYMPFNDDYNGWQYTSCVIAPKKANQSKTIQSITVFAAYDRNINKVWFDNLSLRQEPCSTYTYDANGNVTAVNAAGSDSSFTYSAGNKLTKSQTKANGTYTYKYENSNNNHLVTKITNDNVSMNITYDKYGNSIGTTLSNDSSTSTGKLVTSVAYSADGTQLTSQTNANGTTTQYVYNARRTLHSQTDGRGTKTYWVYNTSNDRPTASYQDRVVSTAYSYSCGNLVSLIRGAYIPGNSVKQNQTYSMAYDGFGNMTGISVGSRQLAIYDYGSQNGNLRSMTYGNGATVSYTYDILDRVTEEKWNGTLKYRYFYSSEGDLVKKLDVTTGKAVNYEYDSLGRLIHSYQTDNGTVQQKTEHLYDSENRLTSQSWQLGDTLYKETFTYSATDGSLTKVAGTGFTDYAFAYDALKRLSFRYNWIYRQNYTYRTNNGNQTTQIASIDYVKRPGGTGFNEFSLGYEYDAGGNITKVTHSTNTAWNASYTYDSQNQLTQEVNKSGTYNYTYDTGGNIRSVGGAETHTYTYGDSEWLDLLTAYDGKEITYDTIGNPNVWHNDTGDWNLSWSNGRQLTRATKGSHIVSYTYDLAGIRDSKTVNGVTYNYITQNGQVVRQTWTSDGTSHVMDFIYDNTGKPYALKYDGATYYYVLNQQGDVISIITHWGESYGSYTYDAWGNIIAQAGWLAGINPIRYRGYYYDSETGLYYLGSRYYDPAVKRFINADGAAFATINPYSEGLTDKNYFAYCDNNPVSRSDDGGAFFNTVIGAVVGGITAYCSAKSDHSLSGKQVIQSAITGAVTGALGGFALDACIATGGAAGLAIAAVGGAVSSGANTWVSSKIQKKKPSAKEIVIDAAVGAGMNTLFGAYGRAPKRAIGKGIKRIFKAMITNSKSNFLSNSGRYYLKKGVRSVAQGLFESTAQWGFSWMYAASVKR